MGTAATDAKEQCAELIAHHVALAKLSDTPQQRELRALLPPEPERFIYVDGHEYELRKR